MKASKTTKLILGSSLALAGLLSLGCQKTQKTSTSSDRLSEGAALKAYVAPGKYDEFYAFLSGGFSGQVATYGFPSGRLLKVIPVFAQNPENGYGYTEETKPMLNTSHGYIPWDDSHHPWLSQTNGETDGRWLFINSNNTPRIARIDLKTFRTAEIIEIPNSGGNHGSPYGTMNSEYLVASTRFMMPVPQKDVAIEAKNFGASISFIKVDKDSGHMNIAFQVRVPAIDYDLASCGKGPSHGWCFFTSYNSEKATNLLEINASQNDKDFIAAVNWKVGEKCIDAGKGVDTPSSYYHNVMNDSTQTATSDKMSSTKVLTPQSCPGILYYIPVAKSPHGSDVDPTGEYFIAGGKLAAQITGYSFKKMEAAIAAKSFVSEFEGVQVLKYEDVMAGEVHQPCLGPLHTEFDGKGFGYTSCFVSSEVVKFSLATWQVVDRMSTFYSLGHLMIPGGNSMKPNPKYLIAMNKITKDRYLPTGPEMSQAGQLLDISGEKMEMFLDFPLIGEPHYAQGIEAEKLLKNQKKFYTLEENKHPFSIKDESEMNVVRKGKEVHIYIAAVRSHFGPDNIEGIKVGDTVYFHLTNVEQDWDIFHGFSVMGANVTEALMGPGETHTLKWEPKEAGVFPYYCTDFCSALHQEMQGYLRISAAGSNTPIKFTLGGDGPSK